MLTMDCFCKSPKGSKAYKNYISAIIFKLKEVFAQHVIPEIVSSNNAPQFLQKKLLDIPIHMSLHMWQAVNNIPKVMVK